MKRIWVKLVISLVLIFITIVNANNLNSVDGHNNNWAVLVSTSRYWFNYRHLANTIGIYRAVRKLGIPDSNIILMLPDDIACNVRNRYPGSVYANKDHKYDLYDDETEVDYRGYEVTVENLLRLLTGRVKENVPNSKRLNSDQNSNVLLYLTGHGGDEFLKFQDTEEMNAQDIAGAIDEMHIKKRYNKLLFISDTCQASTLANRLYSPNVLAIGSSLKGQNSYSHHTDRQIGVGVIEGFTHFTLNALNGLEKDSNVTLQDFIDSFDTRSIKSTPGVRSDLFNSDLNRSLLTDFFSSSPDIEELPHLPPDIGIKEDHLNVIENEDEIVKLSMENQEFEKEGTISIRKLSNTIYLIASVSLFLISIVLVNIS